MIKTLVKFIRQPYDETSKREVWFYSNDYDKITLRDLLNKIKTEVDVKIDIDREGIIALINGKNAGHIGGYMNLLK